MRISDWSSDVCSSDLNERALYKMICDAETGRVVGLHMIGPDAPEILQAAAVAVKAGLTKDAFDQTVALHPSMAEELMLMKKAGLVDNAFRSEEHTSELKSLMIISYAVSCLNTKSRTLSQYLIYHYHVEYGLTN